MRMQLKGTRSFVYDCTSCSAFDRSNRLACGDTLVRLFCSRIDTRVVCVREHNRGRVLVGSVRHAHNGRIETAWEPHFRERNPVHMVFWYTDGTRPLLSWLWNPLIKRRTHVRMFLAGKFVTSVKCATPETTFFPFCGPSLAFRA